MLTKPGWCSLESPYWGLPLLAQTTTSDTLTTLLGEVHQLRLAMERAATTAPQVQLLAARLTVQNERLSQVAREHASVQQQLDQMMTATGEVRMKVEDKLGSLVQPRTVDAARGPRRMPSRLVWIRPLAA